MKLEESHNREVANNPTGSSSFALPHAASTSTLSLSYNIIIIVVVVVIFNPF